MVVVAGFVPDLNVIAKVHVIGGATGLTLQGCVYNVKEPPVLVTRIVLNVGQIHVK